MNTLEKVCDAAVTVNGPGYGDVNASSRLYEDLAFDSLDAVELAIRLEEEFHVFVPDEWFDQSVTIADLVEKIDAKLPA